MCGVHCACHAVSSVRQVKGLQEPPTAPDRHNGLARAHCRKLIRGAAARTGLRSARRPPPPSPPRGTATDMAAAPSAPGVSHPDDADTTTVTATSATARSGDAPVRP